MNKPTKVGQTKKNKVLGEVEYKDQVLVEFPVIDPPRDMPKTEVLWVKITKGNKDKGYGYITQRPTFNVAAVIGQGVYFERGTHKDVIPVVEADPNKPRSRRRFNVKTVMPNEYATMVRVTKSAKTVEKREATFRANLAEELMTHLSFNPKAKAHELPIEDLKAGDYITGGGSDWCVEAVFTKTHVALCRCINTDRLQQIPARELRMYTRLPFSGMFSSR